MKKVIVFFVFFTNISLIAQNFQIGHRTVSPVDSSRSNRVIQDTEIYYPANTSGDNVPVANGEFPVIVFGHGFTIAWNAYNYIWEYFVPKGYICVFPRTEGSLSPNHGNFGGDLKFLAQWMQQQNQLTNSPFLGKVANKSAVMGHSMGGGSTYLAASGNSVFTTVVSLAAAETNPSAETAAQQVNCPVLSIAGEEDCVTKPNEHQIPIFNNLASSIKYYTELAGSSHCNFTSSGATTCFSAEGISCLGYGPFISRTEQNNRTLRLAEPWLEFFLKERCASWQQFLDTLSNYISTNKVVANQQIGTPTMPQPAQPTITQNGNQLQSSSATSYQWYLNGNPIPGATSQSYTPSQSGSYTVQITDAKGCTATSNSFNYTTTAGSIPKDDEVVIYPNPTNGNVLTIKTSLNGKVGYQIMDLTGKIVQNGDLSNNETIIKVDSLIEGMYFIKLFKKDFSFIGKFIKN